VKGIYRALAYQTEQQYWNNFYTDIYPEDLDSSPPPGFAFTDRLTLYRLVGRIGGFSVENVYELPVDPKGLTLDTARGLATRIDAVEQALAKRTTLAEKLHCTSEFAGYVNSELGGCQVASSLQSAIEIADSDVERGLARGAAAVRARQWGSRSRSPPLPASSPCGAGESNLRWLSAAASTWLRSPRGRLSRRSSPRSSAGSPASASPTR